MKDVWNSDPAAWRAVPLAEKLELMRKWHCTGPSGQSASLTGTRSTLDATLLASQIMARRENHLRMELLTALLESSDYDQLFKRAMELVERYEIK